MPLDDLGFLLGGVDLLGIFDIPWATGVSGPIFSTGDPPELIQAYEVATLRIADNPKDTQAYFMRGAVSQGKGWYRQALSDFMEVLRQEPKHAQAWLLMSEVLSKLGNHDAARKARAEAQAIDPEL